jgi:hypothetical protein
MPVPLCSVSVYYAVCTAAACEHRGQPEVRVRSGQVTGHFKFR